MQFSDFDELEQQRSYLQLFAKGEDGQILMNPQWRLMLQGVGQRQWSPATKSPVDVACEMVLRVGLRSYESGRVHLNSARQAFAKARNC